VFRYAVLKKLQGGGASPGDLKLSGVTLGAKEKVGGDKVENQELGAESLHVRQHHNVRVHARINHVLVTLIIVSCKVDLEGLMNVYDVVEHHKLGIVL
jgi:hypothetical protein